MNVELIKKDIDLIEADFELVLVFKKDLDSVMNSDLKILNFKAKDDSVVVLPNRKIYIGCSKKESELIKIAISNGVKKAISLEANTLKIDSCDSYINEVVEGAILGGYIFDRYKSEKSKNIDTLFIASSLHYSHIKNTLFSSNAVNITRELVNRTPDDITPKELAKKSKTLSDEFGFDCEVYNDKYLFNNNMNAFLAVSRASSHSARLIHMKNRVKNPKLKVAIVGKGLTYDSGGLSLKPSSFMSTMKSDKSGACAVIGVVTALSQMDLDIEVHGIVGACENMIGGNAYKPDDVLVAKNKVSIEIQNTDAEGRLVLADCLCYAQDEIEDLDYIIDVATLTGACVVGVGEYTSGVMGHSEKLKNSFIKASKRSGELATTLDFNRYLEKTISSKVADVCHISNSRYGGAITAAQFLDKFIKKENKNRWVHLDIAGPAYVEKDWGYNPFGASGAGVRMILSWLNKLNSKNS
jgi:leucyl aminopeptidase